jgi:S1-C subfamily serine protease
MIDVILIVIMALYAMSGFRQGLLVGALSLGGFLGGALLAMTVVPLVADNFEAGMHRSFVVLAGVLLLAWLGQILGSIVGVRLRQGVTFRPARVVDQVFGAVVGLVSVALVMWFIGGALRASPSPMVARAVASSTVLRALDDVMPQKLSALAEDFRETVAGSSFPRVFAGVTPEEILPVPAPDPGAMSQEVLDEAAGSIVKITGEAEACNRGQEGSGFVVADHRVATNAHVVAGMSSPQVQVAGVGRQYRAKVVLFDAQRDIAVLSVPRLPAPALDLGTDLSRGNDAVVVGFPRDGPFTVTAARVRSVVQASGEDIYGSSGVVREVYQLYAEVQPGNSGGPLLAPDGSVVGIVFAKSLDDETTGYALTMAESLAVLQAGIAAGSAVDTGGCAVG